MAYETPLTIAEVMSDISANKYVFPSIQREYVWSTEQIETLFDSLMRDYPIGTFLFWEINKDHVISMVLSEIIMRTKTSIIKNWILRDRVELLQCLMGSNVLLLFI